MWRWIVWFGLGLVLLLVLVLSLLWWWQARKKVVAVQDRVVAVQDRVPGRFATRSLHQAFMRSLSDGNTSAQIHALLAWARAERPHLRNLGELSAALNSPAQRAAIQAMQQRQYSHLSVVAEPDLAKAFVKGFIWRSDSSHNGESALPPLYPFDLNQS